MTSGLCTADVERLCKDKTVQNIEYDYAQFGLTILFTDGATLEQSMTMSYDQPVIEYEYTEAP